MDISVVIPNLHSKVIDQTIQSILDQKTNFSFEILIVGQDKYDLSKKYLRDNFFILETDKPTPPGIARNLGVNQSKGNFIFFIDSDCIASPNLLDIHMNIHLNSPKLLLVGGGVTFSSNNYLELADNVSTFHENMLHIHQGKKKLLPSINMSISRKLWRKTEGFNANLAGEDAEFTTKLFLKYDCLWFEPKAYVVHKHNRHKLLEIIKHAYNFGRYSIKGDNRYQDDLAIPIIMKKKWLSIIFSPLMALYIILKMIFIEKLPKKYWQTLPLIYFLKIVWCFGLAYSDKRSTIIRDKP